MSKIIPSDDRVLVETETITEKKIGAVHIPANQLNEHSGVIVALGNDVIYNDRNMKILSECYSVGDKVLFEKNSGMKISNEGKEYYILRRMDILAKIIQ